MGTDITSVKHDDFSKNTKFEMLRTLLAINDIITLSDNWDDIEAACCRRGIDIDKIYALFTSGKHKEKPAARFANRAGTASRNDSPTEAFYLANFLRTKYWQVCQLTLMIQWFIYWNIPGSSHYPTVKPWH